MIESLLAGGWKGIIAFENTGLEDEETLRFVDRCANRWKTVYGAEVIWLEYARKSPKEPGKIGRPTFKIVDFNTAARDGEPFLELFGPRKDLPNRAWRECTKNLKIRTLQKYLKNIGVSEFISYTGIRHDEPSRWNLDKDTAELYGYEVRHPLVEWKTTKADVLRGLPEMLGFDLEIEDEIFGNCDLCFLKGPNKRLEVMRRRPQLAQFWIKLEKLKGRTFVKGVKVEQMLEKALKGQFTYCAEDNFDIPCTCNIN